MIRGCKLLCRFIQMSLVVSAGVASGSETAFEVRHTSPVLWQEHDGFVWLTDETDVAGADGAPGLPWQVVTLPSVWPDGSVPELVVLTADTLSLTVPLGPQQPDTRTSDTATVRSRVGPDTTIYSHDEWFPSPNVRRGLSGRYGDQRIAVVYWCPYRYNPVRQQLIVIERALICPVASPSSTGPATFDTVLADDILARCAVTCAGPPSPNRPPRSPGETRAPDWVWPDDPPLSVAYVVITQAAFVPDLRPMVEWKARRGVNSGLATVEAIVSRYPAVDTAASIREYIRAAHAGGLEWALLAGDETIVPIRYAYAELEPYTADPHKNQICDLYFGELDGDWDVDGDGIYGEYFDDQAQLYPEVYVGRLPFSDAAGATGMVEKLIAYERGPEQADYLTRSLSVCADQMRDWSGGLGQHALVADIMSPGWSNDLTTMVESPSGNDPTPQDPEGQTFPSLLSAGYGWVNYYVHGRVDGFIVRSPGILGSPLTYVYTYGADGDGNGHLNLAAPAARPGIHLSAACDQGAFDLDSPPFSWSGGKSVAEQLLSLPQGGAVAFIGQSRWGWVSTSYRLIKKFYEYVGNDSIPNHVGVYQSLAKSAFPGYRDLVYGNNLYGDPEMPVWRTAPEPLEVSAPATFTPGPQLWMIEAFNNSGPVPGAVVTLAVADSVWEIGQTDGNGRAMIDIPLPFATQLILTVSRSGYRIWTDTLPISIIADIGDDQTPAPAAFSLSPNYPNPFNPATILRFSLSRSGATMLSVFDVLGRRVRGLIDGRLESGIHTVEFAGVDDHGRPLASGIYFARLESGGSVRMQKMVLLR